VKEFSEDGCVDDSQDDLLVDDQADADADIRPAMKEVGGSVEWVDHPSRLLRQDCRISRALLIMMMLMSKRVENDM